MICPGQLIRFTGQFSLYRTAIVSESGYRRLTRRINHTWFWGESLDCSIVVSVSKDEYDDPVVYFMSPIRFAWMRDMENQPRCITIEDV